jgi:hypothetical protein
MKRPVQTLDGILRRAYGIFECSSSPDCLFRLRQIRASHALRLHDLYIPRGSELLELHAWNEHWPPMPPGGPDLTWGKRAHRLVVSSLDEIARYVRRNPQLSQAQAIGGPSVAFSPGSGPGAHRLLERLGFVMAQAASRNPLSDAADRLLLWRLVRAYQPTAPSPLRDALSRPRVDLWIPMPWFLAHYGSGDGSDTAAQKPRPAHVSA